METIRNHSTMKNIGQMQNFRRNTRGLKNLNYNFLCKISGTILQFKKIQPTKRTGTCYLCLNEKLFIIEHQANNLLNQRNELISKCRHKNKFNLMNYKTWPLCVWSFFLVQIFFSYLDWHSKSPYLLRIGCNAVQINTKCEYFSRSWRQNIASLL